jgi:hypothetical protein
VWYEIICLWWCPLLVNTFIFCRTQNLYILGSNSWKECRNCNVGSGKEKELHLQFTRARFWPCPLLTTEVVSVCSGYFWADNIWEHQISSGLLIASVASSFLSPSFPSQNLIPRSSSAWFVTVNIVSHLGSSHQIKKMSNCVDRLYN